MREALKRHSIESQSQCRVICESTTKRTSILPLRRCDSAQRKLVLAERLHSVARALSLSLSLFPREKEKERERYIQGSQLCVRRVSQTQCATQARVCVGMIRSWRSLCGNSP